MKYLLYTTPDSQGATPPAPTPEQMAAMGAFVQEGFQNGTLIATGGLNPQVTRITSTGGTFSLTDGPFTEAKEAVVGFALIQVGSKEEAVELSKRFWRLVGDGQGIIQQIFEPGDMGA